MHPPAWKGHPTSPEHDRSRSSALRDSSQYSLLISSSKEDGGLPRHRLLVAFVHSAVLILGRLLLVRQLDQHDLEFFRDGQTNDRRVLQHRQPRSEERRVGKGRRSQGVT